MTSYAQVTIHSQKSKINKSPGHRNTGRLIKGWRLSLSNPLNRKPDKQDLPTPQKLCEQFENTYLRVENRKKDRLKIKQQVDKKKPTQTSKDLSDEIINSDPSRGAKNTLLDSSIYPSIFYKKTTMRAILREFIFPLHCKALPPNDQRSPLIHQIIVNLFNQINISVFNILIGQDEHTNSYYIFFSDTQITPYTRCCNSLVYVQIKNNSIGFLKCNGKSCRNHHLAQFIVDYEDGKKLWKNLTFLTAIPNKDATMKEKIAKCIGTGRYKSIKLKRMINETSKLVEEQFYTKKKQINEQNNHPNQFNDLFITNGKQKIYKLQKKGNAILNEEELAELTSVEDKNIESLKMKLTYISKRHKGFQQKLSKSIIDDGKVFNKQFEMNDKIDEIMRKTKNSAYSTFNNFPRLMDQMRDQQQRKTKSFYKKQNSDSFMKN